jgi:hypothetical protein
MFSKKKKTIPRNEAFPDLPRVDNCCATESISSLAIYLSDRYATEGLIDRLSSTVRARQKQPGKVGNRIEREASAVAGSQHPRRGPPRGGARRGAPRP